MWRWLWIRGLGWVERCPKSVHYVMTFQRQEWLSNVAQVRQPDRCLRVRQQGWPMGLPASQS